MSAYYPLTELDNPTVEQMKAVWAPYVSALQQLYSKYKLPIIFTEVGYVSLNGANRGLWSGNVSRVLNERLQANAYEALFQTFEGRDWWRGVYWWAYRINPAQGGPADGDFTPRNKLAEDVLRSHYGAPPRSSPEPFLPAAETDSLVIYRDFLTAGWSVKSGGGIATIDTSFRDSTSSGECAIRISLGPRANVSLYHPGGLDTSLYDYLEFYFNVGKDVNKTLKIGFREKDGYDFMQRIAIGDPQYTEVQKLKPNTWQRIRIPLDDMGASRTKIDLLTVEEFIGFNADDFFIDEIRLVSSRP